MIFVCQFCVYICGVKAAFVTFNGEYHKRAKFTAPQLSNTRTHTQTLARKLFSALYRKLKVENQAEKITQRK